VPGTTDVPPISGKGRRVFLVGTISPTAEAARIDGDARLHVSFASHEIVSKGFPDLCSLQLLEREKRWFHLDRAWTGRPARSHLSIHFFLPWVIRVDPRAVLDGISLTREKLGRAPSHPPTFPQRHQHESGRPCSLPFACGG